MYESAMNFSHMPINLVHDMSAWHESIRKKLKYLDDKTIVCRSARSGARVAAATGTDLFHHLFHDSHNLFAIRFLGAAACTLLLLTTVWVGIIIFIETS